MVCHGKRERASEQAANLLLHQMAAVPCPDADRELLDVVHSEPEDVVLQPSVSKSLRGPDKAFS